MSETPNHRDPPLVSDGAPNSCRAEAPLPQERALASEAAVNPFPRATPTGAPLSDIRRIASQHSDRIPYAVVHSISRDTNLKLISVESYPGLEYLQVIQTAEDGKLISVWNCREEFTCHGDRLVADLSLEQPQRVPMTQGPVRAIITHKLTILKRIRQKSTTSLGYALAAIAAMAGVLSHMDTILDLGAQYTVPARIELLGSQTTFPSGVGQRFSVDFDLQNTSAFASSYVEVTSAEFLSDPQEKPSEASAVGGIALEEFRVKTYPLLKPADSETFSIAGRALRPGRYILKVEGSYRPIHGSRAPSKLAAERTIEVWDAYSITRIDDHAFKDGSRAHVPFLVRSGQTYLDGLTLSAELMKVSNIEFGGVVFPGVFDWDQPIPNTSPGNEAVRVTWTTRRLDAFDEIEGKLILATTDGTSLTSDAWKDIAKKIQFPQPVTP